VDQACWTILADASVVRGQRQAATAGPAVARVPDSRKGALGRHDQPWIVLMPLTRLLEAKDSIG
jgi:hypothetical protein